MLSSCDWDKVEDLEDLVNDIIKVFSDDAEWGAETLSWYQKQVFGAKDAPDAPRQKKRRGVERIRAQRELIESQPPPPPPQIASGQSQQPVQPAQQTDHPAPQTDTQGQPSAPSSRTVSPPLPAAELRRSSSLRFRNSPRAHWQGSQGWKG